MPRQVDIFIPAKRSPNALQQPGLQQGQRKVRSLRPVANRATVPSGDVVAVPRKKPALDHLRPWYISQKPQAIVAAKTPPVESQLKPQIIAAPTTAPTAVSPKQQLKPRPRPQLQPPVQSVHHSEVQKVEKAVARAQARPVKKHRLRSLLLLSFAGVGVLLAGNLLQSVVFGELLIGAYAIFALVRRIESRTTFMLALVSLACILVLLFVRPDPVLMGNFAIYAFLFMLVGTVSLAVEARR